METVNENGVKEITTLKRVQFTDCDGFGHLNNAAYLNYFMNEREEQVLEAYGLSFPDIHRKYGEGWVVRETRVAYLVPAMYGDRVRISTRVVRVKKSSVITEGVMRDEKGGKIHAVASVQFVWVDLKSGRPKSHPKEIGDLLDHVDTGEAAEGLSYFDERLRLLKRSRSGFAK